MAETWDDIRGWRAWAEEIRTIADQFAIPSAQEQLRRVADTYDGLADDAEARLKRRAQPWRGESG